MQAQDIFDAAVVLALEALEFGQSVLRLLKRPRIEVDTLGVAAQRGRRLLQLRQRRFEQLDRRLETPIDGRQLPQLDGILAEPADDRRVAFVKQLLALATALMKFFAVRQNIFAGADLLLLVRPQPSLSDLFGLRFEQRLFAPPLLQRCARLVQAVPRPNKRGIVLFHRLCRRHPGESIEQVQMSFRLQQGVVFVLAVNVHKGSTGLGEQAERAEAAI